MSKKDIWLVIDPNGKKWYLELEGIEFDEQIKEMLTDIKGIDDFTFEILDEFKL